MVHIVLHMELNELKTVCNVTKQQIWLTSLHSFCTVFTVFLVYTALQEALHILHVYFPL